MADRSTISALLALADIATSTTSTGKARSSGKDQKQGHAALNVQGRSSERLLQVLVNLVEEGFSRKPGLTVTDKQRQVLVMKPASMVSTVTFSSVPAKRSRAWLQSSFALCFRPRVQAKMDAVEFVDVGRPF